MSSCSSVVEVPENNNEDQRQQTESGNDITNPSGSSQLPRLLPHNHTFYTAALSLKSQVVEMTWKIGGGEGDRVEDATVYRGLMGTAFICLRSYQATGCSHDLLLSSHILRTCASIAHSTRQVTFLCGRGGIFALGAVISDYTGDRQCRDQFLDMFLEVARERDLPVGPEEGGFGMSYDLLCGRAGFLWAALFIKRHLGDETLPDDLLMPVVEAIMAGGRAGASANPSCPLMYRWHGTRYWGAPHGLAGILHVLLHFPLSKEDLEDVNATLKYMMSNRLPSGNYPSSEGNPRDKLVQWSHGATGMAITLCKASQVFPEEREFRNGAIEAGEVVWKNGLVKKVGLADGVAGNAYAFLSLYRLTKDTLYIERAKAFASFLYNNINELVSADILQGIDYAYSLFSGLGGPACLFFDLLCPEKSRFPGYEL